MKKTLLSAAFAIVFFSGLNAQTPTWSENTACIFYTNCIKCHFPGGPGPFSLLDYASAYTSRFQIKAAVQSGYMPPWPPDHNYQTYAHERLLTQQEIDVIAAWVDGGAPQGDTLLAPPVPPYNATGSQLTQIDFSAGIGNYTNTATQDDYRCFIIPTNFASDTYISNIELVPGTRSMVHHVLIYSDTAGTQLNSLDANDPGPGYTNFGGTGTNSAKLIGAYVPGSQPIAFPSGMGVKLPANGYIVLQIHYPQGTDGDTDSSRINLTFASSSVREVSLDPILHYFLPTVISPYPLQIAPNSTATFTETYTVPNVSPLQDNFTVLSVAPHMHKVGRSIKCYAIKPNNDTINLINIPNWDFRWQGQYEFRQPIIIPEGTILKAEAFYDNTSANPNAPNPNTWVYAGEATTNEMMLIYFSYLYTFPGDENIIIDTNTVKPYWNNCFFMMNLGNEEQETMTASINLYPNPTHDIITFSYYQPASGPYAIRIMDLSGRMVYEKVSEHLQEGNYNQTIQTGQISAGTYIATFQTTGGYYTRKFVVVK